MPTLSAMFRLLDGYSSTIHRIEEQTDRAARVILEASRNTDRYNDSMKKTEAAAGAASKGLTKVLSVTAAIAAAKKTMDLTDTYTNTSARLSMVTENLEEQKQLQEDIFAAANRARGSYTEMANAAAKLKMLAGDSFGSNQEALAFTELLTKSLKISGAGTAEQNSAFLQLTQALTSGKLQGDEFRSVMENAPMVANAIAEYMGIGKDELKELSSKGVITSDIIKNAMFTAADDIEAKFSKMPLTFADNWERIKNAGIQAFSGVFEKINEVMNSDMGQAAINNFIGAIHLAGSATEKFIDLSMAVWPYISPFIYAAAAAVGAYALARGAANVIDLIGTARTAAQAASLGIMAVAMWATTGATWAETTATLGLTEAELGLNAALYANPIMWIVGLLVILIGIYYAAVAAVNHFAGTSISATGLIVGALFAAGALIGNLFIAGWNLISGLGVDVANVMLSFAEFFANFLDNPVLAIMNLIADLANFVIGVMQSLAKVIDTVFGSNLANTIGGWSDSIENFKQGIASENSVKFDRIDKTEYQLDRLNYSDAFNKGYGIGAGIGDTASDLFGGSGFDFSELATAGNPATIKGTGKGGAVKVENEEDIEWMRKLAERDYVARIAQNTLAPNIRVEFTGPVTKEADTDGVIAHVAEQLKEIIATAPEGVPA